MYNATGTAISYGGKGLWVLATSAVRNSPIGEDDYARSTGSLEFISYADMRKNAVPARDTVRAGAAAGAGDRGGGEAGRDDAGGCGRDAAGWRVRYGGGEECALIWDADWTGAFGMELAVYGYACNMWWRSAEQSIARSFSTQISAKLILPNDLRDSMPIQRVAMGSHVASRMAQDWLGTQVLASLFDEKASTALW